MLPLLIFLILCCQQVFTTTAGTLRWSYPIAGNPTFGAVFTSGWWGTFFGTQDGVYAFDYTDFNVSESFTKIVSGINAATKFIPIRGAHGRNDLLFVAVEPDGTETVNCIEVVDTKGRLAWQYKPEGGLNGKAPVGGIIEKPIFATVFFHIAFGGKGIVVVSDASGIDLAEYRLSDAAINSGERITSLDRSGKDIYFGTNFGNVYYRDYENANDGVTWNLVASLKPYLDFRGDSTGIVAVGIGSKNIYVVGNCYNLSRLSGFAVSVPVNVPMATRAAPTWISKQIGHTFPSLNILTDNLLGSPNFNLVSAQGTVFSFNLTTGRLIYETRLPNPQGTMPSPCVEGERATYVRVGGTIFALSSKGEVVWKREGNYCNTPGLDRTFGKLMFAPNCGASIDAINLITSPYGPDRV